MFVPVGAEALTKDFVKTLSLPRRVLHRLDALARATGETRSGFIARMALEKAHLKYPDASIEAAHFTGISGLDRRALTALAMSSWIDPLLSNDRMKTIKWE